MLIGSGASITKRLTRMNILVSGAALLIACGAFVTYDWITSRETMVHNLSIQAQIAGSNSGSALLFNDSQSAESTLSALKAAPNIVSASIYTAEGRAFAFYSADGKHEAQVMPALPPGQLEHHWFEDGHLVVARKIVFEGKPTGTVYIRSDLQDINQRLKRYAAIATFVFAASLIAALMVGSIFQRAVAEPIVHLAEITRVVSRDKNYSLRASATGNGDEPDILIHAFNDMLDQIQQREEALRDAHRELEQRVVARTAQLPAANKEIEQQKLELERPPQLKNQI